MIDNNHLVYGGVILVFLIGAMIVVVAGMILLGVGSAVAMAVRFRNRRARPKRQEATPADELDARQMMPPVTFATNSGNLSKGQIGRHWGHKPQICLQS
jgi:hypothetical protein